MKYIAWVVISIILVFITYIDVIFQEGNPIYAGNVHKKIYCYNGF